MMATRSKRPRKQQLQTRHTHRPDQHDGVHAHSVQYRPDPGGACAYAALTLAFLLVRAALSQMDVPTRSSYETFEVHDALAKAIR